jgi:hypothetical protein
MATRRDQERAHEERMATGRERFARRQSEVSADLARLKGVSKSALEADERRGASSPLGRRREQGRGR